MKSSLDYFRIKLGSYGVHSYTQNSIVEMVGDYLAYRKKHDIDTAIYLYRRMNNLIEWIIGVDMRHIVEENDCTIIGMRLKTLFGPLNRVESKEFDNIIIGYQKLPICLSNLRHHFGISRGLKMKIWALTVYETFKVNYPHLDFINIYIGEQDFQKF